VTLQAMLTAAQQQLAQTLQLPASEARVEADILLREAMGRVSRAWLITHSEDSPNAAQQARFAALMARRLEGEPVAYILGRREFYGLSFGVTPAVLIPRPDTETLVDAALQKIPQNRPCRVLDLGTGSGAIAIAIASQRPNATVTAVDRSAEALAVAGANAERLAPGHVQLLVSAWFSTLDQESFDVIVSNPPYIAAADSHLAQGDLRFEPASALASGQDGLDDIRRIVRDAPSYLAGGGWLLLEHGYDQAERVGALLREAGFIAIGHAADLAGIQRVTLGRKPPGE
jgi:release factor glutamine methyltransferase